MEAMGLLFCFRVDPNKKHELMEMDTDISFSYQTTTETMDHPHEDSMQPNSYYNQHLSVPCMQQLPSLAPSTAY